MACDCSGISCTKVKALRGFDNVTGVLQLTRGNGLDHDQVDQVKRFAKAPLAAFVDRHIPAKMRVLLYLIYGANEDGLAWPGLKTIATAMTARPTAQELTAR
jgi:hypothetical protein